MTRTLFILLLALSCDAALGQELRDSSGSRTQAPQRPVSDVLQPGGATLPIRPSWSPAWEPLVPPEPTLGEQLFTPQMLRNATLGDPNRHVRIYRSDPKYYRMTSFSLMGPDGITPGPTNSDALNRFFNTLYVYARERAASRTVSAYDYMMPPGNTGMIRSFSDCKDLAFSRGEEQALDVLSRIAVGVWPYRPKYFPLLPPR